MKRYCISAGIILYKPERKRLLENIRIIYDSIEHIYIFNNGAGEALLTELADYAKVVILGNGENIGIASAMNKIMEVAESNCEEWVITYDQDSVSDIELITEYRRIIDTDIFNVAIICPQVVDKRRVKAIPIKANQKESVERCITSASCTRVEAWRIVGGFDEFLFIDLVDNDFCKKIRLCGWKILKLHNVILYQEFGNIEPKRQSYVKKIIAISNFFGNRFHMHKLSENIGKLSYKKNVSSMRVYYTNRNVIYLNKKYRNYGGIGYDCYNCRSYLGFQICFNMASFVRGKEKTKILKAIILGMKDGFKSKVKPIP